MTTKQIYYTGGFCGYFYVTRKKIWGNLPVLENIVIFIVIAGLWTQKDNPGSTLFEETRGPINDFSLPTIVLT